MEQWSGAFRVMTLRTQSVRYRTARRGGTARSGSWLTHRLVRTRIEVTDVRLMGVVGERGTAITWDDKAADRSHLVRAPERDWWRFTHSH